MKIGIVSDTHKIRENDLGRVMAIFKKAGIEIIFHCGDILPEDLDPQKFLNLPVYCALVDNQPKQSEFETPPMRWTFTTTEDKDRIRPFGNGIYYYIGHKRTSRILNETGVEFLQGLDELRKNTDGLRMVCSGHTHFQFYNQTGLVNFVNPGAITDSLSGRIEYAIADTETGEISFGQLYKTEPVVKKTIIGVISDSLRISQFDPYFWQNLAKEFKAKCVRNIIHCGNIALPDIGRKELSDFQVYYNLREDQKYKAPKKVPSNWHLIGENDEKEEKEPVVELNGYRLCVQLDLGVEIAKKTAIQINSARMELKRQYHELDFILCGFTHNCLLMGGEQPYVINPGDVIDDRNFAVIELGKQFVITFGHVPITTH